MAKSYQQLEKEVQVHREQRRTIERRYLPCPDHRDKHKADDECLMCQLERLSAEVDRLKCEITNRDDEELDAYANGKRDAENRLLAESRRYREALEEIVRVTPANQHKVWPHHHHYLFVARAALEPASSRRENQLCVHGKCDDCEECYEIEERDSV